MLKWLLLVGSIVPILTFDYIEIANKLLKTSIIGEIQGTYKIVLYGRKKVLKKGLLSYTIFSVLYLIYVLVNSYSTYTLLVTR